MASNITQLNSLRITGMTSGIDTDAVVKSILKLDQMKIDKRMQAKTKAEWQRDAYKEISNMFRAFRDEYMSASNPSKNIQSTFNFKGKKATINGTNSGAVTISAGINAANGNNVVNAVKQLATSTKYESGRITAGGNKVSSTSTKLSDLDLASELSITGGELTINGKTITYSADDKLQDVINRVNESGAGVTMKYSQLTDSVTFTNNKTGKNQDVDISETGAGNILTAFGGMTKTQGKNAELYINNVYVERESNNFTIDNISYTLNKEFNKNFAVDAAGNVSGDDGTDVSFTISADTDKALGVIKGFIEGYNNLIKSLTTILNEKPNKSYSPLTDEQRESLSKEQQDKWETEAKKGILYNDSGLRNVLTNLRGLFFTDTKIDGKDMTLSSIGIGPKSSVVEGVYVGQSTEMVITDENALRKLLEEKPDMIANLFAQASDAADEGQKYKESGLSHRLYKQITNYTGTTMFYKNDSLDRAIKNHEDMISSLTTKLASKEEQLYKKYAAMESAMAQWQSQGSWLASQFGG